MVPCSTACPEQWLGPKRFPVEDTNTWSGFNHHYDSAFAARYRDCVFQVVFYARFACGQYREIYIEEIRFSDGCDSLMNDITSGTVSMAEVIDNIVAQLIWEDAMTQGGVLQLGDSVNPESIFCSNGGRTYYRIYKGNCGFWGPWWEYSNWKKRGDAEIQQDIVVGALPKWRYRRCSNDCCIDVWHACWVDLSDINPPEGPSIEKIYSTRGKRCLNVHGPNYEMCYYNCADSVEIQQWTQPKGEEFGEITGVREEAIQGWYSYDPTGKELRLYLHWAVPQPFVITLYDVKGQKVLQVEEQAVRADHYITLHLAGMTPGLYLLQVQGATAQFQQTIRIW